MTTAFEKTWLSVGTTLLKSCVLWYTLIPLRGRLSSHVHSIIQVLDVCCHRCSLHDILSSSLFSRLRNIAVDVSGINCIDYMYYQTTCELDGGFDTLPIL